MFSIFSKCSFDFHWISIGFHRISIISMSFDSLWQKKWILPASFKSFSCCKDGYSYNIVSGSVKLRLEKSSSIFSSMMPPSSWIRVKYTRV